MDLSATLSPTFRSRVEDVLRQLDAAAATLDQAARDAKGGTITQWFQSVAGTDSAAAAIESKAYAQRNLTATVRKRAEGLTSDAEALAFLRDAQNNRWADVGDTAALARSLTASGAVVRVGADSIKDLGAAAAAVGENTLGALKLAPLAFLAVGVLLLFTKARKVTT